MISLPKLFTAALAATSVVFAAATPDQISAGLKSLTQKAANLQGPAQSISIINAPLIIIGQGPFPQIIAGYTDIISTATTLAGQLGATSRMARRQDGDAVVADAFRQFVAVNQATLNILIGKAGILEQVPLVGGPVAAVLRGFEAIVDTIAITLINTYEAVATDLEAGANSLDATLTITIQKYEGLQI